MKFKVNEEIFRRFKGPCIGVIIAKGIDNSGSIQEINEDIKESEKQIREKFNTESLIQNPKIDAWRKAYVMFGAKPKEHKSSVENLYRLILNGRDLRHINKIVDIYNLISLKYAIPAGGEDLDKVSGDITLAFASANENRVLLLGDKDPRAPHEGEVIYKDEVSAICRRFNWREAERTKLTENTRNCILVLEGIPPVGGSEIEAAAMELKELMEKFCGGKVTSHMVNEHNPELDI